MTLGRRRKGQGLAFLTALATAFALLVPLSGSALADVSSVDATPESANNQLPGDTAHDITVSVTANDGDATDEAVLFAVISGPNQDFAGNGTLQSDGECTTSDLGVSPATFTCTYNGQADEPGTDTIRVWGDNNGNNVADSGEPSDDVTKTWVGPPFSLTLTPASDSAATGTCNPFTVTLTDQGGRPNEGATINIIRDHSATVTDADLTFCTPTSGPNPQPAAEPMTTNEGDDEGDVGPTDENGQVTFGVESTVEGSETIRAYYDANTDDDLTAGEPTDSSTKTWTASGQDAVAALDCEPESSTNPAGTSHTVTCTATNQAGDPVPDVAVSFQEDGPATPDSATCTTDNGGQCDATFSSDNEGTSNITGFVNQTQGGTPGPDPGEPQDQVTKTWTTRPQGLIIDVTCEGTGPGDTGDAGETTDESNVDCTNPTEDTDEVFTATVTDADGNPQSGVRIDWSITRDTGTDPAAALSANQCTTGADGTCSVTLTNSNPQDGQEVDVQGVIAGQAPPNSDTATKQWQERAAASLTLEPEADTNQTGTSHTVTATVTDQFGDPVQGVNVDFQVSGRNASGTAGYDRTTDSSGQASFTYTDTGAAGSAGDDNISAWADVVTENDIDDGAGEPDDTATKRWIPEPPVAADVEIDMEGCNGTLDNFGDASWDARAADNDVSDDPGDAHEVCASAKTAGGEILYGHEITFTSSGPGRFVDQNGNDLGTEETVAIGSDGYARIRLLSERPGEQQVTASADGQSDSGVKPWVVPATSARNIELSPEDAQNVPGTNHEVTATVTDRFGNPVPGVTVTWSEDGPAVIVAEDDTTDSSGEARLIIRSESEGQSVVTGSISAGSTDCELQADNPPGAPAGNCQDTATKTWTMSPSPTAPGEINRSITLEASRNRRQYGKPFSLSGSLQSDDPRAADAGCLGAGHTVTITRDVVGGDEQFEVFATAVTDTNGEFTVEVADADRSAQYVASVDETGVCGAATSAPETVLVSVKVRFRLSDRRIRPGQRVRMTGILQPCGGQDDPNRIVPRTRIFLYKAIDGVMAKVGAKRTNNRCRATFTRRLRRTGVFQIRSAKPGPYLEAGKSRRKAVRVRRRR